METNLQLKRGTKANLPTLLQGEPAYCTDTMEFFIGSGAGNVLLATGGGGVNDLTQPSGVIATSLYNKISGRQYFKTAKDDVLWGITEHYRSKYNLRTGELISYAGGVQYIRATMIYNGFLYAVTDSSIYRWNGTSSAIETISTYDTGVQYFFLDPTNGYIYITYGNRRSLTIRRYAISSNSYTTIRTNFDAQDAYVTLNVLNSHVSPSGNFIYAYRASDNTIRVYRDNIFTASPKWINDNDSSIQMNTAGGDTVVVGIDENYTLIDNDYMNGPRSVLVNIDTEQMELLPYMGVGTTGRGELMYDTLPSGGGGYHISGGVWVRKII